MRNWKTTAFGVATVIVYIVSYFFPQYKDFCQGLITVLIAGGFLTAKDYNVSGTGA